MSATASHEDLQEGDAMYDCPGSRRRHQRYVEHDIILCSDCCPKTTFELSPFLQDNVATAMQIKEAAIDPKLFHIDVVVKAVARPPGLNALRGDPRHHEDLMHEGSALMIPVIVR